MAGPGDFQLPPIAELRPERIDFSEELRAAEASDRNTEQLRKEVGAIAGGIGDIFQSMGEKSAMAQAQADALHAQLQFTKDAEGLANDGKYTIKESEADYSKGGPAGPSTKTLELDPSFQQAVEETTKNLSEKYKQYPKVQQFIYDQVGKFGVEAHKAAYKAAYEKAGKDLQAANKESLLLLAKNGDGSYDAGNAIIDSDPTLTTTEKETERQAFKSNVDNTFVLGEALKAYKSGGPAAAAATAQKLGTERDLSPVEIAGITSKVERQDSYTMKAVGAAVKQAREDKTKSPTEWADQIDKDFGPAAGALTYQLRVEDKAQSALFLMKAGEEAKGQQLLEKTAQDNSWPESWSKYANSYTKTALEDWKRKVHGTSNDLLTWGSQALIDIEHGKANANDALAELGRRVFDARANDIYGDESAKAAMSLAQKFTSAGGLGQGGIAKKSDPTLLVYFVDGIIGKGLTSAEITQKEHELNAAFTGHHLAEGDYKMLAKELLNVNDPLFRQGLDDLKTKFTDKNGVLDKAGYAQAAGDLINARQANPTKNAGELQALTDAATEARSKKVASDTLTPPGTDVTRNKQLLTDRAVMTLAKSWNLTEIPEADILRGVHNPKTGESYSVAVKDARRGGTGKWYVPTFDQNGVAQWKELK